MRRRRPGLERSPAQIDVNKAEFTANEAELARGRAVVAAFGAYPAAGVRSLNGKMIAQPSRSAGDN